MHYSRVAVIALAVLVLSACKSTVDRRIDPDAPDPVGGGKLDSQDIRTMSDQMSRDIIAYGVLSSHDPQAPITFHITELRNDSSDVIDKELILTRLRTLLFKGLGGRVQILDRSKEGLEAVREEREAKRAGAIAANPNFQGNVLGSDYVLKGTIKDRVLQGGRNKSVYYLVTFELTDLETTRLAWTGDYEVKFETEKSVISR
ncbi:MAG: hypothetical protein AB7I19_06965 [Planctomycetota bacterium]